MNEKPPQETPLEGAELNTEETREEKLKIREADDAWIDNFAEPNEETLAQAREEALHHADYANDNPENEEAETKSELEVEKEDPILTLEEKQTYGKLNPQERQKFITKEIKDQVHLTEEDFETPDGRELDFGSAHNLEQLIRMIGQEDVIKNGLGEEIESATIINLIYDRVLNRNDRNRDWTTITLRHRLREMVYRLTEEYMQQPEYLGLAGLNLQEASSREQLTNLIRERKDAIDAQGNKINGATLAHYIEIGRYDLVPVPLRYKLNTLLKQEKEEEDKKPVWKKAISRVARWFGR